MYLAFALWEFLNGRVLKLISKNEQQEREFSWKSIEHYTYGRYLHNYFQTFRMNIIHFYFSLVELKKL